MSDQPLIIARRFAESLDHEDYNATRALLDEDCVYDTGSGDLCGPEAIIESYSANGEKAKQRFDAVEYASEVKAAGAAGAVITFTDRVRLGGEWHEYQCRQHVTIGPARSIDSIRHENIPGQREQLLAFEKRQAGSGG